MEININDASSVSVKSSGGLSPFVAQYLSPGVNSNGWLSPSAAMNLWELSDVIYTAIDLIAAPFSQMTYSLKDKKTGEYLSKTTDHPLLELLDSPGFFKTSTEVMYGLMVSFLVSNSAYPLLTGNTKFPPVELSFVYPNKASLLEDSHNHLQQISFSDSSGNNTYNRQLIPKRKIAVYQADSKLSETVQITKALSRNGIYPSSPLSRVIYQAYTKYYGNIHNSSMLKNGSRPGGIWSPGDGPMGQDQYEAFKNEIEEKFSGPSNSGRNIVAPRPVKFDNLMLSPKDMDFVKLIESSETDIYNLYHIPLALVSAKTMTMSNFANSQTGLYDMAVLPNAYMVLKRLGEFMLPRYKDGDRYELTFDEKTLPALRARMLETSKVMRAVGSYTEDEIRANTGYEPLPEGGEAIYRPANLISSEDEDLGEEDLIPGVDEIEDDEE